MRIILISYFGLAHYTISLANALSRNHRVMLVLAQKSAEPYHHLIDPAIEKHLVNFPRLRNPLNLFYAIKIFRAIRRFDPEVIHFQGGFIWFSFLLPLLAKWLIITTIHDARPHAGDESSRNMRWFFPNVLAAHFSSGIIVHADSIKKRVAMNSRISEQRITTVMHGNGYIHKLNSGKRETDKNYVLFFGRILKYKGLPTLIKAQPLIRAEIPDVKICIAGEGELFREYESLITDRSGFSIYNHFIDQDLMIRLFHESSVVVLPYSEASQSGIISIAFSFGRPVVATNVGALPEIVEHQKTGLIVPPGDEKKLAAAIIYLLQNRDIRKQYGENAYLKARNEMSWENVAERTVEVYRSLCKSS